MHRSCGAGVLVVGGRHRLPDDPCEYNHVFSLGPGCNSLRCESCGARVRIGPLGATLKEGAQKDLAALYATEDWRSLPFITTEHLAWRLYACKCSVWEEGSEHLLVNDHQSPGAPNLPWSCGGHPAPTLPLALGELSISATTDWTATVERILKGACPRPLERDDEGPSLWLSWLYAYLRGLPVASKLSRAVADRVVDRDESVVGAVLYFYRSFPDAEGMDRVIAHAESNLDAVFVHYKVPERGFAPRLWDVFIAAMQKRTDVEVPHAQRIVDVVRKVMLRARPDDDAVNETLNDLDYADAFREDDFAWMAENIVALEAAAQRRWTLILDLLYYASRRNVDLEAQLVIAAIALIQSRKVDLSAIRAWIQRTGRGTAAWALPLEAALQGASGN
jgi:hypothetical protein